MLIKQNKNKVYDEMQLNYQIKINNITKQDFYREHKFIIISTYKYIFWFIYFFLQVSIRISNYF